MAQPTPSPSLPGGLNKRERSPAMPLAERSPNSGGGGGGSGIGSSIGGGGAPELAPALWRANLRPTGLLVQTPGGTLQTPGGGRNPTRRRLRSPAMMSSPFKSSVTFGGTPLKSGRKPVSARKPSRTPSKSPMQDTVMKSPSTITYGISSLFVSPGGSSAHGSPAPPPPGPPPGLGTPIAADQETYAELNPACQASPWRQYDSQSPGALKWNDVRRPSQSLDTSRSSPYSAAGSPAICKIEEDEPLVDFVEPPTGNPEEASLDASDSSLIRSMAEAENDPVEEAEPVTFGPRISEQMAAEQQNEDSDGDDSALDESLASMLDQSSMLDSSGLDLVDLKEADEDKTSIAAAAAAASPVVPGRKPKPAERPGWEVAWSNSQSDWYWWNPETRESTWTDPAKFELVPRKVVLRTTGTGPHGDGQPGEKMIVTEKKILSEDGGYSDVKLVDGEDGTKYALKAMQRSDVHWDNVTNEKEVMVELDMCSHPFLVGLIATGKDKDTLYMLLELCPGGDLFSRLDEERHFDDDTSRFYISQCVLGLEALHRGSVRGPTSGRDMYLHRDIKPENVLMGGDGYIMMADFGFTCRMLHSQRTFSQVGTTEYMAPELINNSGYNQCADYWSIGILIYELLVGNTPFAGDSDNKKEQHGRILAYSSGAAELEWPDNIDVSDAAKSVVSQLLARKPEDRLGMGAATAAGGCAEILAHEWFAAIDLDAIKRKAIEPPWIPKGGEWPAVVAAPPIRSDDTKGERSKTKVKCGAVTADGAAGYRDAAAAQNDDSEDESSDESDSEEEEEEEEEEAEDEVEYCPDSDDDFADF
jgi:serine/threonine protein kinase